jgi:uncharacterized membrane protein
MTKEEKRDYEIKRIGGHLNRVIPILDNAGNVVSHVLKPFMVELKWRDVMQIIIGASLLSIPVGFTEETWHMGEILPFPNVLSLALISVLFLAVFIYSNFYKNHLREYRFEYIKRVIATYILSLLVVGLLLTIINKCPWGVDNLLAIKRIIIVAFPASMSAVLSDTLK